MVIEHLENEIHKAKVYLKFLKMYKKLKTKIIKTETLNKDIKKEKEKIKDFEKAIKILKGVV